MSKKREIFLNAFKFKNHKSARDHEIKKQVEKSHSQRMQDFKELQKRVFGVHNVDIRASGVAKIMKRKINNKS